MANANSNYLSQHRWYVLQDDGYERWVRPLGSDSRGQAEGVFLMIWVGFDGPMMQARPRCDLLCQFDNLRIAPSGAPAVIEAAYNHAVDYVADHGLDGVLRSARLVVEEYACDPNLN
jgi:hypothetical protein